MSASDGAVQVHLGAGSLRPSIVANGYAFALCESTIRRLRKTFLRLS